MKITLPSKTALSLCAAFALFAQSKAYASCSSEEAIAKAGQLAAKVAEITKKDPARAEQLRAELKQTSPETSSDEMENACEGYDQRLNELEKPAMTCKTTQTSHHSACSTAADHPDR